MREIHWAQIWTRLKREDPILVSARQSLEIDLRWRGSLTGMELWTLWELAWGGAGSAPEFLLQETTALSNPNRERAWILHGDDAPNGPPGKREGEWSFCLVWDRGSPQPHHPHRVCERLMSHRSMECKELIRADVWGFRWSAEIGNPLDATRRAAMTRMRTEGLLVNPHVQSLEVFRGHVPRPWWPNRRDETEGDGR
jgi:hypothetical protein